MFRLIALLCLAVSAALPMQASVTHTVKFGQGPVVMVWQDGAMVGRGGAVSLEGETAPALATDWIGGGALEPVSFSADPVTERRETIEIASNAPVNLRLARLPSEGKLTLRLLQTGPAAQYGGPVLVEVDFAMTGQDVVLHIPAKTAAKPGAARDQSLVFELVRTGPAADIAMLIETDQ